mgnify:CR=1 FL=1
MNVRVVEIFNGDRFHVPRCIQRIDHRATHGWQLRYGGTKLFSDHTPDGSGAEASLTTFLRVQEALAYGDGSTALSFNMHLIRFGGERESPTYPEQWFAEMCRGAVNDGWLANTVATEEGLGSPAGGGVPETTAQQTADGWLLNVGYGHAPG